ncbi:hypothetical protein PoB_001682300 [Plakobranchus ocellatus]|uniref:Uncharacterized protein n=1 Tax=Plakobranchus ocellatus TaxID=259542 RepID=A0AAV3Z6J8_9GAST|nr:hypothetical protein PoB_001682300 [Plakobranchus ocellatus]
MGFSLSQRALVVLAVIICTLTQYAKTQSSQEAQLQAWASSPEVKVGYSVQLIERNPTIDGNNFTVTYTSEAENLALAYCINYVCKVPETRRARSGRSYIFSFKVPHDATKSLLLFSAQKGDYQRYLWIKLDNNGTESLSQTVDSAELQDILINPPEEAVYNPGENVTVKVGFQYPIDHNKKSPMNTRREVFWRAVLCDIKKQKILKDLWSRDLIKLIPLPPEKEYKNLKGNRTYIIKTSTRPVSGYLQFAQKLTLPSNIRLWLSQLYVVRPANQNGPYPDGFIWTSGSYRNESCKYGQTCVEKCSFIGADLTGVDVKEVLPDGTEGDVPTKRYAAPVIFYNQGGFWNHLKAIFWWVHAQRGANDSQDVLTYKCFAFDRTYGNNKTEVVQVQLTD